MNKEAKELMKVYKRLEVEERELADKIIKLDDFMSDDFRLAESGIPQEEIDLMKCQLSYMREYHKKLFKRMQLIWNRIFEADKLLLD